MDEKYWTTLNNFELLFSILCDAENSLLPIIFLASGKDLTDVVSSETSGDFRTLLMRLLEVCFLLQKSDRLAHVIFAEFRQFFVKEVLTFSVLMLGIFFPPFCVLSRANEMKVIRWTRRWPNRTLLHFMRFAWSFILFGFCFRIYDCCFSTEFSHALYLWIFCLKILTGWWAKEIRDRRVKVHRNI